MAFMIKEEIKKYLENSNRSDIWWLSIKYEQVGASTRMRVHARTNTKQCEIILTLDELNSDTCWLIAKNNYGRITKRIKIKRFSQLNLFILYFIR